MSGTDGAAHPGEGAGPFTVAEVVQDRRSADLLEVAQRRGSGFWWTALLAMVLLSEQTALAVNLIAPALVPISAEFQTTQAIWTITAFLLVGAVVTPTAGKFGDVYGKRRVLLFCGVVATAGSLVSALAPSFAVLMIGRGLAGFGLVFLPLIQALIRDVFPGRHRALAISVATTGVGIVTIVGPFLAGWLLDTFGARSVFWFVVVISIPGLLLTRLLVPETPVRLRARVDVLGAVLLGGGLGALLLGLNQSTTWGWGDLRTVACLVGGVLALAFWVPWERRVEEPLMSIALLRSRPLVLTMLSTALAIAAFIGASGVLPLMLQTPSEITGGTYGFGLSATGVAVWFLPAGVLTIAGGFYIGLTSRSIGFRLNAVIGAVLIALGIGLIGVAHGSAWAVVVGWSAVGMGAMVMAAQPNLLMAVVPVDQRAVAVGMGTTFASLLGAVMTQVVGIVLDGHLEQVVSGLPVYRSSGFTVGFLLLASVALVAAVVGFLNLTRTATPDSGSGHLAQHANRDPERVS